MREKRHSRLKPFSPKESQTIALHMINFFSVLTNHEMKEKLNLKVDQKRTRPLSFFNLINYFENVLGVKDAYRFKEGYWNIITKLVESNILVFSGTSHQGSPPLCNCYYFMKELTTAEMNIAFTLSRALGPSYIRYIYSDFMVLITGENALSNTSTGSGLIIGKKHILTCKHNTEDIVDLEILYNNEKQEISKIIKHPKEDIAVIVLKTELNQVFFPYFGDPNILDNTVILGYPPIPTTIESSLVSQKGEINTITKNWNNSEVIILSSIVRPGSSGGPVISENGYVVGMVIQSTNYSFEVSKNKDKNMDVAFPFYVAVSSREIYKFLNEFVNECVFTYEDYE